MSSSVEPVAPHAVQPGGRSALRSKLVAWVAFSWGLCAFFPVGVAYLHLLLLLGALCFAPGLIDRLRALWAGGYVLPVVAMLCWIVVAAAIGDWFPDSGTRLFHAFRVALVLGLGLLLTPSEAMAAITGFVVGAVLAALVVAVHHVWGLPPWSIWASLLLSRNNLSSGNMISMATVSGICFFLALDRDILRDARWLAFAAALALGTTVALHALSRNSQLLLAVLWMSAVLCRYRSSRATLWGMGVVLMLVAALWQFSPNTRTRFEQLANNLREANAESNYASSAGVRLRMYQEAIQGMVANPFAGTGVGSWLPRWRLVWKTVEERVAPESRQQFSEINNPHNDFLLNGMETGIAGLLLMVWLLVRFIRQGWLQRSTPGSVSVVMGVCIFVTAMVNAPFRDAALGMTLLWLLGASAAMYRRPAHA